MTFEYKWICRVCKADDGDVGCLLCMPDDESPPQYCPIAQSGVACWKPYVFRWVCDSCTRHCRLTLNSDDEPGDTCLFDGRKCRWNPIQVVDND